MKKFIAVAILLACTSLGSASSTITKPTITVTGTGKILYVPDLGYIQVGVSSEGLTAAEAWKQNEAIVKKVFEGLRKLGIAEKDLKTGNINVQPRYRHVKDEEPEFLGYTVSYDLSVTVRKLDRMSAVLDCAVAAGANRNLSVSFGHSDLEKLLDEARIKAVADARKKANLYVTGAGAKLGVVLSISDASSQSGLRHYPLDAQMVKEGKASMPIAAGEQETSVQVNITWAIDNRLSADSKTQSKSVWDLPSR